MYSMVAIVVEKTRYRRGIRIVNTVTVYIASKMTEYESAVKANNLQVNENFGN